MEINSKQRRYLTQKSQKLKPVVYIGKNGLTEQTIKAVEDALTHHELLKIKFVDLKELKQGITEEICKQTDAVLVRVIGHIGILYRENPDKKQYRLPD